MKTVPSNIIVSEIVVVLLIAIAKKNQLLAKISVGPVVGYLRF